MVLTKKETEIFYLFASILFIWIDIGESILDIYIFDSIYYIIYRSTEWRKMYF